MKQEYVDLATAIKDGVRHINQKDMPDLDTRLGKAIVGTAFGVSDFIHKLCRDVENLQKQIDKIVGPPPAEGAARKLFAFKTDAQSEVELGRVLAFNVEEAVRIARQKGLLPNDAKGYFITEC